MAPSWPARAVSPRPCFPARWRCRPAPVHNGRPWSIAPSRGGCRQWGRAAAPATSASSGGAAAGPGEGGKVGLGVGCVLCTFSCGEESECGRPGSCLGEQRLFEHSPPRPALGDRELHLISCASFTALLSPSHPGAAALKATGPSSSSSASSGAVSSDRGRAGGAVHVRVSHPGKKLPSGSAASWPHGFSTGQGRRHPTASCPLLGHQHRGTSVSLHPGVGEAPKSPSPWADGDGDPAQEQPGNHSLLCRGRGTHRRGCLSVLRS